MLGLPRTTEYGKRIPKQKFYDNLSISPELKRVFAEQIAAIFWSNKLSPDTLNVAAGDTVDEIEVFTIRLNQPSLDTRVLQQIDKQIPYHIIFVLEYKDRLQAWIGYKEAAASGSNAFKVLSRCQPRGFTISMRSVSIFFRIAPFSSGSYCRTFL